MLIVFFVSKKEIENIFGILYIEGTIERKNMKYLKKYKLIVILTITLLITIFIVIKQDKNYTEEEIIISENEVETNENLELLNNEELKEPEEKLVFYKVDVKGAVKIPGVYEIEKGKRVIDVINKAGGLLNTADTSTINLSKFLIDEMVIIVYTKEEISKRKEENVKIEYIEKECICPEIKNDACIIDSENNVANEKKLVNINTATLEELMTIPKIGESKAKDIIKYREENSGFKKIEDIKNISGIKDATYEAIKDYITI